MSLSINFLHSRAKKQQHSSSVHVYFWPSRDLKGQYDLLTFTEVIKIVVLSWWKGVIASVTKAAFMQQFTHNSLLGLSSIFRFSSQSSMVHKVGCLCCMPALWLCLHSSQHVDSVFQDLNWKHSNSLPSLGFTEDPRRTAVDVPLKE